MGSRRYILRLILKRILAIFTMLAFFSTPSLAYSKDIESTDTNLFIVTPAWKTFTEKDGSGFYFELMRMVYEPLGISIRYQITPWARCEIMVANHLADALLGSYKEQTDKFMYPERPIWSDISAVVFKPARLKWQGLESLRNKHAGWIRGYSYDEYLDVPMKVKKLIDNKQAWTLLALDRIDFYIDSLTDIKFYIKENEIDQSAFRVENILKKDMYVRFTKTAKGKKLANIFDQRLDVLEKNGQLEQLYLKWGYADYYPTHLGKH